MSKSRVNLVSACDVHPGRVEYLWRPYIPTGCLSVLDGDPDKGKSTVAIDIEARVTRGWPMPDGSRSDLPCGRPVIIVGDEDSRANVVIPRLLAAGADPVMVSVLDSVTDVDDEGRELPERPFELPRDIEKLGEAIEAHSVALVVIDPLNAYVSEQVDMFKDHHVRRRLLTPLTRLAEQMNVSILAIRHLNKSPGGSVLYRGGGSIGIIGQARAGMVVAVDPDDENRRIFAVTKLNLAKKPPALAFHLVPVEQYDCARVAWDGATKYRADELLGAPAKADPDEAATVASAGRWVTELLEAEGPMWVQDIREARKQATVAPAWRALERARDRGEIVSFKVGGRKSKVQGWKWRLPTQAGVKSPGQEEDPQTGNGKSPGQSEDLQLVLEERQLLEERQPGNGKSPGQVEERQEPHTYDRRGRSSKDEPGEGQQ